MNKVFEDLTTIPIILKKTSNIYKEDLFFENASRVKDYYMEKNKKFTWLKRYNSNLYIYGDPFPKYNFG